MQEEDELERYSRGFWEQVAVSTPAVCWEWVGRVDRMGYPIYRGQRGHRLALWLSGIPMDARIDVDHRCGNTLCCSPYHLAVMTHRDHARLTRSRKGKYGSVRSI